MMNSEFKLQSDDTDIVYQSIKEACALLSVLEERSRTGKLTLQSEIEMVELVASDEELLVLEDSAFLLD